MEPKILYRAAVEHVPIDAYTLPLDKAEVLKPGTDLTIVSYGTPLYTCSAAIAAAEKDFGCSVELIDLRTIYPWDRETVLNSVKKTGRAIVVHESMVNGGVGAEVAATVQEKAFLRLEAPVRRVAGWATHTGLMFERFVIPDVTSKFYEGRGIGREFTDVELFRGVRCYSADDRLLKHDERTKHKCLGTHHTANELHLRPSLHISILLPPLPDFLTSSRTSPSYRHYPSSPYCTDTPASPYTPPPPASLVRSP